MPARVGVTPDFKLHWKSRAGSKADWIKNHDHRRFWWVRSLQPSQRKSVQELPTSQIGSPQVGRKLPLPKSLWRSQFTFAGPSTFPSTVPIENISFFSDPSQVFWRHECVGRRNCFDEGQGTSSQQALTPEYKSFRNSCTSDQGQWV